MSPGHGTEAEIARRVVSLIEEIAAAWEDPETAEGRAWGEVFKLAHWARAPLCRRNHPSWGDALATEDHNHPADCADGEPR